MKKIIYPALIFILLFGMFSTATVFGQESGDGDDVDTSKVNEQRINWDKVLKDWSVGIHGGVTMPYTDVRSYDWFRKGSPINEYQYTFGGSITKMLGGIFGIQARYNYGKLQGFSNYNSEFKEDVQFWEIVGIERPFYFSTNFHQPSVNVYMNFSNMFLGLNRRIRAKIKEEPLKERCVSAYGRIGVGAIWFDSELRDIATHELVSNKLGRGVSGDVVELVFPFAMGLKFKVNKLIDINIEGEFTFVHDDKLDAFIIEDVTDASFLDDILNPNSATTTTVRNSLGGRYDKHFNVNAGILFKFGTLKSQKEHIEWVNPLEAYMDDNDEKVQYLLDNMYVVKDADNDGVIDELDLEPTTAPDVLVDTHGRTLDSDGDGINDNEDPEPYSTPSLPIVDGKNVYPKTMTTDEIKEYVASEINQGAPKSAGWSLSLIFFDLDKSNVKTDMISELYKVATVMKKYPDLKVNVKGHTDIRYTDSYNMKLSQERVNAAINYLVENYNIDKARFLPVSFGKTENLVKNAKKEAEHALNRRVEFTPANY